jgi:hypothetical protein
MPPVPSSLTALMWVDLSERQHILLTVATVPVHSPVLTQPATILYGGLIGYANTITVFNSNASWKCYRLRLPVLAD